jgi:hypothetical protein
VARQRRAAACALTVDLEGLPSSLSSTLIVASRGYLGIRAAVEPASACLMQVRLGVERRTLPSQEPFRLACSERRAPPLQG